MNTPLHWIIFALVLPFFLLAFVVTTVALLPFMITHFLFGWPPEIEKEDEFCP